MILLIGFILVLIAFWPDGTFAGNSPKFMVKMATIAPRGSYIMEQMDAMDAEIRQQTKNEVGIKIYYGAVQGDENDVRSEGCRHHGGGNFAGTTAGAWAGVAVPD